MNLILIGLCSIVNANSQNNECGQVFDDVNFQEKLDDTYKSGMSLQDSSMTKHVVFNGARNLTAEEIAKLKLEHEKYIARQIAQYNFEIKGLSKLFECAKDQEVLSALLEVANASFDNDKTVDFSKVVKNYNLEEFFENNGNTLLNESIFFNFIVANCAKAKDKGFKHVCYYDKKQKTWINHLVDKNGIQFSLGILEDYKFVFSKL